MIEKAELCEKIRELDRAMLAKGHAVAMAANGRNFFVIKGALMAAQRGIFVSF